METAVKRVVEKIKEKTNEKAIEYTPFEEVNEIKPLKMFVIIVPYGQANGIIKILHDLNVAMSITTNGEGTYMRESQLQGPKKQLIFTFIKEEDVPSFKEKISERFHISSAAKGIAFSIKLSSVAGVSVYKFLTNTRQINKENKKLWKKSKTN